MRRIVKPILETERLYLRTLIDADAPYILEYRLDERCAKYQRWGEVNANYIKNLINRSKTYLLGSLGSSNYGIVLQKGHILLGDIYLHFSSHEITLGFTLAHQFWSQGYATEIIKGVLVYLKKYFPNFEIIATVVPENQRSRHLLSKVGFIEKGYNKYTESIGYIYPKE